MSYWSLTFICGVAAAVLTFDPYSLAQAARANDAAAAEAETITVGFGDSSAPAGNIVTVPITFSAPESAHIGALTITMPLRKAQLAFTKIDPSGLTTAVDAKVEAQVKTGPAADTAVLEVIISTLAAGGSRQPIPVGPVAYVTFTIPDGAQAGTAIALESEASALTTDSPPKKAGPLVTTKGTIEVAAPGIPPCFFYMH